MPPAATVASRALRAPGSTATLQGGRGLGTGPGSDFPGIGGFTRGFPGNGGLRNGGFGSGASATAFPETEAVALVVLEMVEQVTAAPETADQETVDAATADAATADQATAAPEATDLAMAIPATAAPAMAVPETAVPAMAVPETPAPETDTADLLTEQAFFERATASSDHPVSYDTGSFDEESRWPTFDLEGREQRRAHFTRVVGIIVGTLAVGALLAVTRPGPNPVEAAAVAASSPVVTKVAEIQAPEPPPTLLPELSVSAPDASSSSVESAPSSLSAPTPSAPAASVARPRKRVPRTPIAAPRTPIAAPPAHVESDKLLPPTARFAD